MGIVDTLQRGLSKNSPVEFTKKLVVYACLYSRFSSTLTATPYWSIASRYHCFQHRSDLRKYDIDIDPFAYRWVEPDQIRRFSGRDGSAHDLDNIGRVLDGNWDKTLPDKSYSSLLRQRQAYFEDHVVFQSMKKHFEDGVPWEETKLVRYALAQVKQGNRCWGSDTPEDVIGRCTRFDRLYESIKTDGYRTKCELLGISPHRFFCYLDPTINRYGNSDHLTRTGHHPARGFRRIIANEILVDIGRDGEFLFVDGRHRLAIAKLLDLEYIPVTVLVRHRQWVKRLQNHFDKEQQQTGSCVGYVSHPDITSIVR